MNFLKSTLFICLCLLVASCGSDSVAVEEPKPSPDIPQQQKLYLSFSVGNDNKAGQRAGSYEFSSDAFTPYENTIKNGKVFIYDGKGKTEHDAVCVSSGDLYEATTESVENSEFSTKPVDFKNIELSDFDWDEQGEYYALVILNANDSFQFPSPDGRQTFSQWALNDQTNVMYFDADPSNNTRKYLTMANATGLKTNVADGSLSPYTLAPISAADIHRGPFPTSHVSSTSVIVQRNVARMMVSLKNNQLVGESKLFTVGNFRLQLNMVNWKMDVINASTYPVMKTTGLDFSAKSYSHTPTYTFDRILWAVDPNYSDKTLTPANFKTSLEQRPIQAPPGVPLYILENTMDYDCMLQGQTSRAVIRCKIEWKIAPDKDNPNTLWDQIQLPDNYIYGPEDDRGTQKAFADYHNNLDLHVYKTGEKSSENLWDRMHIEEEIVKKAQEKYGQQANVEITWKYKSLDANNNPVDLDGGYYSFNQLLDVTINGSAATPQDCSEMAQSIGLKDADTDKIAYYQSGWCYYVIRIRHYDDDEGSAEESVAWDDSMVERNSVGKLIARYQPRHLGRYGVVRNTFYEMVIAGFKNLGSPEPFPELTPDDTDDIPNEYFLDFTINVTPWGKRLNDFKF